MGTPSLHIDIAIIGGGIAGLWALNLLRTEGYSAVLFERDALGGTQTMASQGIIHGGTKYALSGVFGDPSQAIAGMPDAWRECLAGRGPVDLSACRVASKQVYLWSQPGRGQKLAGSLAGTALRSRVRELEENERPPALRDAGDARVSELSELVLDVMSLVDALVHDHRDLVCALEPAAKLRRSAAGAQLVLPRCTLAPRCLLLAAGAGNAELLAQLGATEPRMQRRPLQQVLVRHEYPEPLFAHCIGISTAPRLTVTTHRRANGDSVWYLGGDLADRGADLPATDLVELARAELSRLLPWIDLGETEWRTLKIDRAEPHREGLRRPDSAFVGRPHGIDNTLVTWPTKLTLAPAMGEAILRELRDSGITPRHQPDLSLLQGLAKPATAQPCWEQLFA